MVRGGDLFFDECWTPSWHKRGPGMALLSSGLLLSVQIQLHQKGFLMDLVELH